MSNSGFEGYRVDEIREALILNGYDESQANSIKGKSSLVYELQKLAQSLNMSPHDLFSSAVAVDENDELANMDLSDVELDDDSALKVPDEDVEVQRPIRPAYASAVWSDFVMNQFEEDEMSNGNPTVPGMRRLVNLLLGDIIFSGAVEHNEYYPSHPQEVGRASCVYEIQIQWKENAWLAEEDIIEGRLPVRTFRGFAGSYLGNTDDDFAIFPEAIAETRAESRALRKALGLQNVVSHEELTNKDARDSIEASVHTVESTDSEWREDDSISTAQRLHIEAKCKTLNIDPEKFINLSFYEGRAEEKAYESIDNVPRGTAAHMIRELNRYQSDAGDESRKIPEVILLENE